jgi:hypothetical protein
VKTFSPQDFAERTGDRLARPKGKESIMTRKLKLFICLLLGSLVLASTASINAQRNQRAPERQIMIERERIPGPDGPPAPPPDDNFMFIASEMNFDGKLVKGSPYSAQAVTERNQTLSDGNRIINKSTASVYRDGQGRTRREQTLIGMATFTAAGGSPQTIFISDPVAGVNYALDSHTHVAHKMQPMRLEFKTPMPQAEAGVRVVGPPPSPEVFESATAAPPPEGGVGMVFGWQGRREENSKTESLGRQTIEGVEAEGTRNTLEIPAGEIGNERPIEIVFERWYSPELQVVVMTRHSDPRFGETVYRLTNISRSEPDPTLFEVPAEYRVREGFPTPGPMRMKRRGIPE